MVIKFIFFFVIIAIILIYLNIYIGVVKDNIQKKKQEQINNLNKTTACLLNECDKNYYFSHSDNQITKLLN